MKDLRLTVALVDKLSGEFKKTAESIRKEAEKLNQVTFRQAEAHKERMGKLQKDVVAQVEDQGRKLEAITQAVGKRVNAGQGAMAAEALRIQKQAAIAEASLVVDRFDRRIAVEKVKHAQIMAGLKENHAAMEAETRRHNAVVGRIQMDQANFANTPFQKMLQNFEKLNGKLGQTGPMLTTVAGNFGGAAKAAGVFGESLNLLSMGRMGIAIGGVTALSMGVNKLISEMEKAAELKANLGKTMEDPAKAKALIDIMERFDKAAAGREGAGIRAQANKDFKSMAGESLTDYRAHGGADLRQWSEAQDKKKDLALKNAAEVKSLEGDIARARAAMIQDETAKQLKLEDIGYQEQKRALAANKHALEQLEILHAQKVSNIRQEAARADTEFNDQAAAEFRSQQIAQENEKIRRIRDAAAKERKEAIGRDERKTEQIYSAQKRLEDVKAGENALYQLQIQQRRELEMYAGNEAAITRLMKAHKLERDKIDRIYAEQKAQNDKVVVQNYMNALSAVAGVMTTFGGKSKEALLVQSGLALAQIYMNTQAAAMAALAPPPLGLGPVAGAPLAASIEVGGAISAGIVIAQAAKGISDLSKKGYATGTGWAPGGMAWVGERGPELVELPRGSKVHTAGESIDMANRGYGGVQLNAPISITIQGGADAGTAERVGAVMNRELRGLARKIEMAEDRRLLRRKW